MFSDLAAENKKVPPWTSRLALDWTDSFFDAIVRIEANLNLDVQFGISSECDATHNKYCLVVFTVII